MKRSDDFEVRSSHLVGVSDAQLYDRFWQLAEQIVNPFLEMGTKYTTPAIERSILLRMGFSSLEAKPIVELAIKKGLMGKGCGNLVWKLSKNKEITIREAGLALSEGKYWADVESLFTTGGARNDA